MNKTILCLLMGVAAFGVSNAVNGQSKRSSERISKAIHKVESINALNGVYPNDKSYKTTSTDRAIKTGVGFFTFYNLSSVIERYDSFILTNDAGKYSEVSRLGFRYYPNYPMFTHYLPLEVTKFNAKSIIGYLKIGTQPYALSDSTTYVYNSNGDLKNIFSRSYSNNHYFIETYTYNSANKIILHKNEEFDPSGVLISADSTGFRRGMNYVVIDDGIGGFDSLILDANGRTTSIYYAFGDHEEYTYDANGYVSTYKEYNLGSLELDVTLSFEPNYKQYSYESYFNFSNNYFESEKRILVGQSGVLDSVYMAEYAGSGAFLGYYQKTDVSMDSYGNVTSAYIYEEDGDLTEWYRYYYEDVVTDVSDLSRPFSEFKLYPNPGTLDDVVISTAENFNSVTVSSISGQRLMESLFRPRNEMRLNTSSLSPGSYFITVRSGDGQESTRLYTKI